MTNGKRIVDMTVGEIKQLLENGESQSTLKHYGVKGMSWEDAKKKVNKTLDTSVKKAKKLGKKGKDAIRSYKVKNAPKKISTSSQVGVGVKSNSSKTEHRKIDGKWQKWNNNPKTKTSGESTRQNRLNYPAKKEYIPKRKMPKR